MPYLTNHYRHPILTAPFAGIIASKRCNNVKIYNNTVYNGDTVGIFLHRSSDDAEVYGNTIYNNKDAGIVFFESFGGNIHDNNVTDCKYGIRLSVGASDNKITNNVFKNIGFPDPGMYPMSSCFVLFCFLQTIRRLPSPHYN